MFDFHANFPTSNIRTARRDETRLLEVGYNLASRPSHELISQLLELAVFSPLVGTWPIAPDARKHSYFTIEGTSGGGCINPADLVPARRKY